ncbi:MAG: DnaD domain protein [Chloroflexota bacterium]
MTKFKGFSAGKINITMVHAQFITELVPMITDLAELKVCLFCYHALTQKDGQYRYLTRDDFGNNHELMQGLSLISDDAHKALDEALALAVEHNFLLCGEVQLDASTSLALYFMNTSRGRVAIQQLMAGNWQPDDNQRIEILPERPTVFSLYEENIGVLTPIIADHLKEAEDDFSYEWIVDAITLAIENNARSWRYIRAILDRWQQEGRTEHEKSQRPHQRTNEYAGLNWSDFTTE